MFEGGLVPDPLGQASGRGAYVCPTRVCIDNGIRKGGFARSFRSKIGKNSTHLVNAVVRHVNKAREESCSLVREAKFSDWLGTLRESSN